jgi:hypothetical protein
MRVDHGLQSPGPPFSPTGLRRRSTLRMDPRLLAEAPGDRQKQPAPNEGLPEVGPRNLGILPPPSLRKKRASSPPFREGSAAPAVLSAAVEAAHCDHLPRIALPLAIENRPRRAASRGIAKDQAVVGLVRPRHRDFDQAGNGVKPCQAEPRPRKKIRSSVLYARSPLLSSGAPVVTSRSDSQVRNPAASWRRGCYRVAIVEAGWRQCHASPSTRDWTS